MENYNNFKCADIFFVSFLDKIISGIQKWMLHIRLITSSLIIEEQIVINKKKCSGFFEKYINQIQTHVVIYKKNV